jgi:hypothetical protein
MEKNLLACDDVENQILNSRNNNEILFQGYKLD